jgi:protein-S-isoprenylcysteine O-methyltransferase Ste14
VFNLLPGLLMIFLFMLAAVAGLVLVQRLVPIGVRQQHNDVAGFIYAVLGIAYAVLMGLVVVATWEQFRTASDTVEHEANELAELFWLGHRLPDTEGHRLQELAQSYARVVADEEWPLMARGESSPRAWALIDEIRLTVQDMNPHTQAEQVLYDQGLERVHDLADARRDRLLEAREGIPGILWVVLVVGGIVAIGFTYLFGLNNTASHLLMVAALALIIGLVLFTIGSLEYPFAGDVRVGPDAFKLVLERFATSKLSIL